MHAFVPSGTGLKVARCTFSRATLANWIIIYALHKGSLVRTFLIADETRIQVLKKGGRNPGIQSFLGSFVRVLRSGLSVGFVVRVYFN